MKVAPLAEVKAQFSRYVDECSRGPIVVTRNGRPVAVIVAAEDEDELERLVLAHTPALRRLLQAAEERIYQTGGVAHDDFWKNALEASKSRRWLKPARARHRTRPKK